MSKMYQGGLYDRAFDRHFLQQLAQMGLQKGLAPAPILISTLNCNWSSCVQAAVFSVLL